MGKGYVAVFDSGIGGLSVLKRLTEEFPTERFLYYGDNQNAPYGNLSAFSLKRLAAKISFEFSEYEIKCAVIACNTLSLTAREVITSTLTKNTFCIYPPAESYEYAKINGVLIATEQTCRNYRGLKYVRVVPLKNLAGEIEKNIFSLDNINLSDHLDKKELEGKTLIIGCTHYEFIKNRIIDYLKPPKVISGILPCIDKIKKSSILSISNKNVSKILVKFIGQNAKFNSDVWEKVIFGWSNWHKNK